jgi:hypothetical protein
MTDPNAPEPASGLLRRRLEALIPATILVLRVATHRTPWFFDWMIVLSVYWILYIFLAGRKARTFITLGVMLLLLGIYLSRVLPNLVDTFLFCL